APERQHLHDALSEKPPRCVVGPQLGKEPHGCPPPAASRKSPPTPPEHLSRASGATSAAGLCSFVAGRWRILQRGGDPQPGRAGRDPPQKRAADPLLPGPALR